MLRISYYLVSWLVLNLAVGVVFAVSLWALVAGLVYATVTVLRAANRSSVAGRCQTDCRLSEQDDD